jgi:uncharacterized protein DUF4156
VIRGRVRSVRASARVTWLLPLAQLLAACASSRLTAEGAQVAVPDTASAVQAPAHCRSLGAVVGMGAGPCGSGWVSKRDLAAFAMDDLRNKAAELGANYVEPQVPEFSVSGELHGTRTSSAAVRATAYRCDGAPPLRP